MLDSRTTDHALIAAAADPADSAAWNQLHAAYHPILVRHCIGSGLTAVEAEDTTSRVLSALASRLNRSAIKPGTTSLRGWLSETTNRFIFEVYRTRRRDEMCSEAVRQIQEWLPPAFAPDGEIEVREKLESHLWSVCLARVRNEVSPIHWQIFESYVLKGNTSANVAKTFNTTHFNVRVVRGRIISRIKQEWRRLGTQQIELPE
jgi:DNA-directed RNA polymerase specialized sigma24 family protein